MTRVKTSCGLVALALLCASLALLSPGFAQDAGAPTSSASPPPAPPAPEMGPEAMGPEAPPQSDVVMALWLTERQIQALLLKRLDLAVDTATLFDVDLKDERAMRVEAARLRRILRVAEAPPVPASASASADEPSPATSVSAAPPEAPAPTPESRADDQLLKARLAVDQARLSFYVLTKAERDALVADHRQRQEKKAGALAKQEVSEAELEKERAHAERVRAEKELADARSEAAKLLGAERVRLLEIRESQAALGSLLAQDKVTLTEFSEQLLSWQRPADGVLKASLLELPEPTRIDTIYDALARNLATVRDGLSEATAAIDEPPALTPVGEDALGELPVEVDRSSVDKLRGDLLESERQLMRQHAEQRWEHMRQLKSAMRELSRRRLALLPLLTSQKRGQLGGFTAQAVEQAGAEIRQVTLVLRYHLRETRRFVATVRETGDTEGSAFTATVTALKWMIPIGVFIWWRRRAEATLRGFKRAAVEEAKKKRIRSKTLVERVIQFYQRIRNPVEWLALLWTVIWFLPPGAAELLEVQLVSTALSWTLGGQLVVRAIDASFHEGSQRKSRLQTAELRFRTLRFLGRVVVTFGLVLALTSQLVGKGTIYEWVWTACWFSILPIFLLVLRWWRYVAFHHVELQRKKGPVLEWVEKNQTGWQSFPAAVAGSAFVLAQLVTRFVRVYVLGFDIVKRLLAYWFRREVEKKSESRTSTVDDASIAPSLYASFDPEIRPKELVASVADKEVDDVIARIRNTGGAVYAVVGERGSGKSTLLSRIMNKTPDTAVVCCPVSGITAFHGELRKVLELPEETSDAEVIELLNKREGDNALLVDDAQHLVRPVVDGLEELDRLVALARASSVSCTWVFAFDAVIWQYFKRAREVRPLFDDIIELRPWSEEGIVRLLASRSDAVELDPDFSRLVGALPPDADEVDMEEALERARNGFYRLLWDYSLGNPGVSLHFWRESLRCAADGSFIVRLFEPPDTSDLDRLPDSTVFVLRVVVQLERATIEDVLAATLLAPRQVEDALRYAMGRGYIDCSDGRYRIRWGWFRTITRFLARRHLLASPYK